MILASVQSTQDAQVPFSLVVVAVVAVVLTVVALWWRR